MIHMTYTSPGLSVSGLDCRAKFVDTKNLHDAKPGGWNNNLERSPFPITITVQCCDKKSRCE